MLIGKHTYGNYNPVRKTFWCTHGAWEGDVVFLEEDICKVSTAVNTFTVTYEFIDKIPEDYNYT